MAEQFTLRFDVGPDAPIATLTTATDDLRVVAEGAMGLARSVAEEEARRYLNDLVANEGYRALADQVRRHELPVGETFERDMTYLEQASEELDMLGREFGPPFMYRKWPRRYHQAALLSGMLSSNWSGGLLSGAPWEPVIQTLLVAETADRLPAAGPRVRSLTYSNPVVAQLILEAGAASAALGYLLTVIATLGPRRRREIARAGAEARIQSAHARDVEDLVERRMQLRRLLLNQIARGEIALRPEDISDALLDRIGGAADRLAERELNFERLELPG